ncbi:hypothetical protein H8959_013740 [Pygathrix nigripes]
MESAPCRSDWEAASEREAGPGFAALRPFWQSRPLAPARGNEGRVSGSTVPSLRLAAPAAPQASSLTRGDGRCYDLGPDAAQAATPRVPAGLRTPRAGGGADAALTPARAQRLTCGQPGNRGGPGRAEMQDRARASAPRPPPAAPPAGGTEARPPLLRPRTHLAARTTGRLRARPTHAHARRRRPAADTAQPSFTHLGTPHRSHIHPNTPEHSGSSPECMVDPDTPGPHPTKHRLTTPQA